ncbi:Uncharacterised protein [Salmonella enterica subsp. enterica serovar Bovismorbificans]|uniref:Uncharacterized protein n=1 Tax=Salmonella enterica subsp. enterica serovar Bovismorbificans TaxID=58097 RepID=A0A655CWW6_SALET|nr:Uncharacterised protein [Salmonella enterica subsp. enterica serovar Bovismorbificans]
MMMLLVSSVPYELSFSVSGRFPLSVPPLFPHGSMCPEAVNDIAAWFISTGLPLSLMKVKVIF